MREYAEDQETFAKKFDYLINLIKASRKTVVFTGAGVSTMSGIPDFRGKHGVYNAPWQGLSVEEILSLDYFYSNPEIFYKWAEEVWYHLEEYQPNIVHTTLAKMEGKGYLPSGIFTQNIDFLHQRAGSKKVFELHGSAKHSYCTNCHAFFKYEEIAPIVRRGEVPHCPHCKGLIKPDIVFYGENLDSSTLKRADIAFAQADLALVLGTSLTVYPAAYYPRFTAQAGGKVVIVNAQPTDQDYLAELTFRDLEQVFYALNEELDKTDDNL